MKTALVLRKLPQKVRKGFLNSLGHPPTKKNVILKEITESLDSYIEASKELNFLSFSKRNHVKVTDSQLRKYLYEILQLLLIYIGHYELKYFPTLSFRMRLDAIIRWDLNDLLSKVYWDGIEHLMPSSNFESLEATRIRKIGIQKNLHRQTGETESTLDKIQELTNIRDEFDNFIFIEKAKLTISEYIIRVDSRIKGEINISRLPQREIEVKKIDLADLYYLLYLLISQEEYEDDLIKRILIEFSKFPFRSIEDFTPLYNGFIHFFIYQGLLGNQELNLYRFELNEIAVSQKLFEKEIETSIFRNIIFIACQAKKYNWALLFSEDYKNRLPSEEQETAYSFNKARIYINMKQYEDVITTLRDVEYKDTTYNLNSKLMLMVSFFELNEYETLLSTVRAFKVFLRRRRNVSVARKSNFTGFCDALYNIMLAEEQRDSKRIWKAKEIIESNPAIPNTDWLREKIEELKL
ncbi:MAG: hypothetical protein ACJA01_001726 [Saprospiraceae bacterium]|jgi:hypothetical protein